jgi:hypothetical protein
MRSRFCSSSQQHFPSLKVYNFASTQTREIHKRGRERIDPNDVCTCWMLLCTCWRRLGVPFIVPKGLGAVGASFGKLSLPSVGRRTGQSGGPPNMNNSLSGARSPSFSGEAGHCALGTFGAPDTVRCTPDSPVRQPTVGSGHALPADCATDHWRGRCRFTGQSGEFLPQRPHRFPRAASSPAEQLGH